jgi:type II secretory pathway pseudopilin PulG
VLILLALFVIALSVAAPLVAKDAERDKEVEAVQRGKQYALAIRLYYKRYGAYPTSIKQLEMTNNVRYLRKHYLDPITGKDDWRLIHVGEAKVPPMGFFGQPLSPGVGSTTTGLMGNGTGYTGAGGSTGAGGIGVSTISGGAFTSNSATGTADPTNGGAAQAGTGFTSPGATSSGTGTTGTSGNGFDIGGGPIVGVGIPVQKKSIVVYHKQDAFNKWEFTYDPAQDQQMLSSSTGVGGAQSVNSNGTFGSSSSSSGTQPTNNSIFGSNNGGNNNGGGINNGGSPAPTQPTPDAPRN